MAQAEALHQVLGAAGVRAFLDIRQTASGEGIPEQVLDGLLAARVVVVFLEREYFTRRYCEEEWTVALMPYRTLLRRGDAGCAGALQAIVVARPASGDIPGEWDRLPPELRVANWPAADDTETLADLVRAR